MGGAGKTPIVMAITELLKDKKAKVVIVSRGYKGDIKQPTLVDNTKHSVNSVGDEPLMLAKIAPTYIAAKRSLSIKLAQQANPDFIIMDDGMQNPSVIKDLTILVLDGKYGLGNGFMIPAGPLREPFSCALKKADAVIFVGSDEHNILKTKEIRNYKKPILMAKLEPYGTLPNKTKPYIAFAGIGNPNKFFATLQESGYDVKEAIPFPDHYNYSDKDINWLIHKAEQEGIGLITTEKDATRIPSFAQKKIKVLPVRIVWEDPSHIKDLFKRIT